jgi:hypothetical protein
MWGVANRKHICGWLGECAARGGRQENNATENNCEGDFDTI